MSKDELEALFRRLGAPEPQSWATSQAEEGIPQLHRFLFLRQMWRCVVSEDDDGWIDQHLERTREAPDAPYAGVGQALAAMNQAGVSREQITDLVRGMQAELLFDFCYHLCDPGGEMEDEVQHIGWTLLQEDGDDPPGKHICGLHEDVLGMDPTGREMRPRTTVSSTESE